MLAYCLLSLLLVANEESDSSPLPSEVRTALDELLENQLDAYDKLLAEKPNDPELLLGRGSVHFKLGHFKESVDDFDSMLDVLPSYRPRLWQRGISLYYLDRFPESAEQFVVHHEANSTDRENGIWKFMAQSRDEGTDKARREMIEYTQFDREPFPDLYDMFAGKKTPEEVLDRIQKEEMTTNERDKRLFFGHLYVGIHHDLQGNRAKALAHLREAVRNPWGQKAGGGPTYMWHVARIHHDVLKSGGKSLPKKPDNPTTKD
ncbi:Lipoprotein NlpI precursor [Planctomycetes bacterium Pan216]|uniref:Lipoprotein NlpI n=1 Tax=Kolteria novifilia TaxID=2527975 RepID=A0A518B790_9BACT|nr:Lipoprotein NlpI precursor [Planctomycetes bacterium Pan216]